MGVREHRQKAPALAKISLPAADGLLVRQRLFTWLDQHEKHRITWISGPPGSGKTSLVTGYLVARRHKPLWYQIDEGDTDAATFFHYLGLAARQAGPRLRGLPILTPEYLPGLATFIRRYVEALSRHFDGPQVLVVDNYEHIPEQSPIHEIIRQTAECLPLEWRLWIVSRTVPPAPFARLRLHGQLALLEGGDLALTQEEALRLAEHRRPGENGAITPSRVEQLHAETQGWLTGLLLLMSRSATDRPAATARLDSGTRQLLFDYFAAELFERLAPSVQSALMRTALLPSCTPRQAAAIAGDNTVGEVLRALCQQNYFVVQRPDAEPIYEFHPLFRAFLLERARANLTAEEWRDLQVQAADVLAAIGRPDRAALLLQDVEAWERLAVLVLREAAALIATGRHQTLSHWIAALPPQQVDAHPWVSFWRGTARLPFHPAEARDYYEQAYRRFQREGDAVGLYSAWAGVMDTFFYEWRDLHPADRWITELETLRERFPEYPSIAVELRTYWAMGTLLHRQSHHRLLSAWSERGLKLLDNEEHGDLAILMGGYLIIGFLWRGEIDLARLVVERLDKRVRPHTALMVRILWTCAVAFFHSVQGDLKHCLERVNGALAAAESSGLHCWDFLLSAQAARCSLIVGDLAEAERWMAAMALAMRPDSTITGAFHRHLQANAAAQTGDWDAAARHAQLGLQMAEDCGVPFLEAHCHIDLARVLAEQGNSAPWSEHVDKAMAIGSAMNSVVLAYLGLETRALASFRADDEKSGLSWLEQALALSRRVDGPTWLTSGPKVSAELYNRALVAGLHVDHVQRMIRRRQIEPPAGVAIADAWPWPLRILSFGRFELIRDGEPVHFTGKAQAKPLELLKALIASGGTAVPDGQLAEMVWPDADGDTAHQSFATTLHRLRRLLGDERFLILEDRCLSLAPGRVWLDAWAFERLLGKIAPPETAATLDVTRVTRGLALYRGAFLHGLTASWALLPREKLRARYLRHNEALGLCLEQQGDLATAVECYADGLELEPYAESFYLGLMRCYQAMGRTPDALRTYQRYRQVCEPMQLNPSAVMLNLYQTLRG